jgi:5-methylcytosine-specific restriction endonuclease McrA
MGKRHKSTIACDISPRVRSEVVERDEGKCIVCGTTQYIQIAHYISRARLGMGIPQNLGCMCMFCHRDYDQGSYHKEIKEIFKSYLQEHYEDWSEEALIYRKGL